LRGRLPGGCHDAHGRRASGDRHKLGERLKRLEALEGRDFD
jgi:hypothetical protein